MRLCPVIFLTTCLILSVWSCDTNEYQKGCKADGNNCICGSGCSSEYIYKTRRECRNALKDSKRDGSNICFSNLGNPCLRGICILTSNDRGFVCRCEGTGFYGQRCEKACLTAPSRGSIFPHECIVI